MEACVCVGSGGVLFPADKKPAVRNSDGVWQHSQQMFKETHAVF